MATQGERRAETRQRLLDAAAELFAERGHRGRRRSTPSPSAAERTSGAVYDHFGGKEGLLFALLEGWVDDVAAVITRRAGRRRHARRAARRAVAQRRPPADRRRPVDPRSSTSCGPTPPATSAARAHLARRYEAAWAGVDEAVADVGGRRRVAPPRAPGRRRRDRRAARPRDDAPRRPRPPSTTAPPSPRSAAPSAPRTCTRRPPR